MKDKSNGNGKRGRVFERRDVLDRAEAVQIMEELGFHETEEPGVWEREVTRGRIAPAVRRFQTVRIDDLLARSGRWAQFVRRHRARLAEAGRTPAT